HGLMAGNERWALPHVPVVDLDVASADPVRLDTKQPIVSCDCRTRKLPQLNFSRSGLDCCSHHLCHVVLALISSLPRPRSLPREPLKRSGGKPITPTAI